MFVCAGSLPCGLFSGPGERQRLSSSGAEASPCSGFSCCGAPALGHSASVAVACGASSCSSRDLEHRLTSCGLQAPSLLQSMWNLPRPAIKSVSSELAGRFFPTEPPGSPARLGGSPAGAWGGRDGALAAAGLGRAH